MLHWECNPVLREMKKRNNYDDIILLYRVNSVFGLIEPPERNQTVCEPSTQFVSNMLTLSRWRHLQEIAEPLFDLKLGMEQLASNQTFRRILATLLAIGNFLNSSNVRASVHTLIDAATRACAHTHLHSCVYSCRRKALSWATWRRWWR